MPCLASTTTTAAHETVPQIQRAATRKQGFAWLDLPESLGAVTILDVHGAKDPTAHTERVRQWARAVWHAWAPHHATVRRWAER